MNQKDQYKGRKKQWEKPLLVDLGVESTKTGGGGTVTDFSNTTTATLAS